MTESDTVSAECLAELEGVAGLHIRCNLSGAALTTYCIGGRLAYVLEVASREALAQTTLVLRSHNQPYRVIGAGSNLLVSDQGLDEWVIRLGTGFRYLHERSSGVYEIGAAASLMSMSRELSELGFSGLEFAGGIPASLGGALRMNAGAHGAQMADIVSEVQLIERAGEICWLKAQDLSFAYRQASMPEGSIVTAVRVSLARGDVARCSALRTEFLAKRKATQPLSSPSAGSVFKNPSSDKSAGWLIEQAGLKGTSRGGARISELHANWIINEGRQARARDVIELMELCQSKVQEMFALSLEPEIVRW